ncbi:TPA: hypothetical protein NJV00_000361 [Corynebacterium striatum]|nr:hypothetical protein [Corynebacterium striatum]HCG3160294.1 hypothetical protein [Corynebacterium striatum]HDV8346149.1 hypothetical protein [Corynebacterium striatum]
MSGLLNIIRVMKNHKNSPYRLNPNAMPARRNSTRYSRHPQETHSLTAGELAVEILFHENETVNALNGALRHPRSLARPTPTWRPPLKELPSVAGFPSLNMTLTRDRVGERARARVLGYGEERVPTYLISVRITDPTGSAVMPNVAEAWVRAMVPPALADSIHETSRGDAHNFVWLVDSNYVPVHSPASLFTGFSQAA